MHPKVCLSSTKTMPKHFLNNSKKKLKKGRKWLFWPWKWPKLPSQGVKFWPKISIFGVIYKPLELKIHPKVGLLRPKTMLKNFLNDSKTTLKKSRKRLFWPPKWSKMTPENGQNDQIFDPKFRFWGSFINLRAQNTPKSRPFKAENKA